MEENDKNANYDFNNRDLYFGECMFGDIKTELNLLTVLYSSE
jgi:hypothetical protein